jgi:phage tail sheath protein FI
MAARELPKTLTPGVYVKEVSAQAKPIEGVGTSIAAFVGLAPGGPVNSPQRIANWAQFVRAFSDEFEKDKGPFMSGAYLAHAVYGFFQNGGTLCWVVRIGAEDGGRVAQVAIPSARDANTEVFRAVAHGTSGQEISLELTETGSTGRTKDGQAGPSFRVVVTAGSEREEFDGLTLKRGVKNNILTKVNGSQFIRLEDTGASLPEELRVPAPGTYRLTLPAIPPAEVTPEQFGGDVALRKGMGALAPVDEVTMLCCPDSMTFLQDGDDTAVRDLHGKAIAACESLGDRMAILDSPPGMRPQDVLDWRMNTASYDSKFAALYYPWLEVIDPLSKQPLLVPPSGHIAGIWARTDSTRGVHKSPANEVVLGVNGLGFQMTHEEQGELNKSGINCIRSFPGRGIRVWGARTLSSDTEWRYLNVRRLFNYISESIMEGTQWAVFEPNDERLWSSLRISVSNFLTRTWREGALFGATPEEAFYVKCDAETNPPDVIEAGQVVMEVGIAPVKPAEFVIFLISQFTAGAAEVSA